MWIYTGDGKLLTSQGMPCQIMALSDYGKICWAAWYPFKKPLFYQVTYLLALKMPPLLKGWYSIYCKVKWAGISVCSSVNNHFLLAHLACVCFFRRISCACCKCLNRQRVPKAYQLRLSLTSSPYTRAVCAKGKREESDLYIEWHSCPRIPRRHGCQTPTDGKSAPAQHASTGHINTGRHTPSHTQPQRHTHRQCTQGETGGTHPH